MAEGGDPETGKEQQEKSRHQLHILSLFTAPYSSPVLPTAAPIHASQSTKGAPGHAFARLLLRVLPTLNPPLPPSALPHQHLGRAVRPSPLLSPRHECALWRGCSMAAAGVLGPRAPLESARLICTQPPRGRVPAAAYSCARSRTDKRTFEHLPQPIPLLA
jgi:hypothetical protein